MCLGKILMISRQGLPIINAPRLSGALRPKKYTWPRQSAFLICPYCGATVITRLERAVTFISLVGALMPFSTLYVLFDVFFVPIGKKSTHFCSYGRRVLSVQRELL